MPLAQDEWVSLQITALSGRLEDVTVEFNRVPIGNPFEHGGGCSGSAVMGELVMTTDEFNALLIDGGAQIFIAVDSNPCDNSFITVTLNYRPGDSDDCNLNEIPDECELPTGDRDADGVLDDCDNCPTTYGAW